MKFIDLSAYPGNSLDDEIHHKKGNDLKAVPHGISDYLGTKFDVRGIIQLSGRISKEKTGLDYPREVNGIKIQYSCDALYFLQCSSWHEKKGTKIGEYRVTYSNEKKISIPIVYEGNVVDWWFMPGDCLPSDAQTAWTGENDRTKGQGYSIQFYKYTWKNPYPEIKIEELDFISNWQESAPFLIAITAD
jgi:hypothetical protein